MLKRGLLNRMGALKITSFEEYYDYLVRHQDSRQELKKLLPFLTIGETYFFRYHAHFEALRSVVLPQLVSTAQQKQLRIWSAGCSTGEEPYTLSILAQEKLGLGAEEFTLEELYMKYFQET